MLEILDSSKNGYQGQICGPFSSGVDIATNILGTEAINTGMTIKHLGIQAPQGTIVAISGMPLDAGNESLIAENSFVISNSRILEIYTTKTGDFIKSIIFPNETKSDVIIDYTIGI